ncbi:MAG: type IX secretion system PorP/SprF family membrane protein [Saprospiraceae bacterium]|jgi:type IX secretion system PorP/SprF family membrane protein
MKLVKPLLLFFALLIFGQTQAQDIHWTMFDMSPLTLNPAFTGAYEGTFRIGGIYRDQWNSFGATGFKTPSFYVDANILPVGKKSWLSVGGVIYNDEAGIGNLTVFSAMGSAALHLGLNKKATTVLTIGLQGGSVQRRLDTKDLRFQDVQPDGEILEAVNSLNYPLLGDGNDPEKSYLDFAAGVKLSSKLNKTSDVTVGMTFRHLTTPEQAFITTTPDDQKDLPLLFTIHGQFSTKLSDKLSLVPAFIYNKISTANEIGLQALVGYSLGENNDMTLYFGPGYRMVENDAIEAILRFDYKQFKVGAAYDFNMSSLSEVSKNKGGFEIAVSYIAKIFKEPSVKPVIFCPRF